MEIEKINDIQYFDSKEIISHKPDLFSEPGRIVFKEIKELETRFVTDGEILSICNKETSDIDNYTLDDGYIIEDIDYIRKKQIAFKNCSYVISFDLVLKKNDSDIYIDMINYNVYLKDVNDIELLNKVRKISKSIKKTYRKINNSISSYIKLSSIKTIDKYESENISENVYRIKK